MSKTLREMFDELIMAVPFTNAETRYIPKIKVALEKRMPKKVTFHKSLYRCPSCNDIVVGGAFCKYCGQALDWSDTE